MSNRQRPANTTETSGASWSWLLCPDCASTVAERYFGQAPDLVMSIEVTHSPTCPNDARNRVGTREIAMQFLPPSMKGRTTMVWGEE